MTDRTWLALLCLSASLLFSSCLTSYRYVYRENTANLPALTEKGDAIVSGDYMSAVSHNTSDNQANTAPNMNGYDLQTGYALTDQLSVLGSFSQGWANYSGMYNAFSPFDSCAIGYKSSSWSLGVQYMLLLKERGHTSIYFAPSVGLGGARFGIDDNEYDSVGAAQFTPFYLQSRMFQGYVQPAMYIKGHHVDFGFGFRLSFSHYGNVNTNYSYDEQPVYSVTNLQGTTLTSVQAFALLRAYPGNRGIGLQLQIGNSDLTSGSSNNYFGYDMYVSMGITVNPYQFLKKKTTK